MVDRGLVATGGCVVEQGELFLHFTLYTLFVCVNLFVSIIENLLTGNLNSNGQLSIG